MDEAFECKLTMAVCVRWEEGIWEASNRSCKQVTIGASTEVCPSLVFFQSGTQGQRESMFLII